MQDIFYPRSVAVVGVSNNESNLGRNIILNLIDFGFDGIVYAVGPKGGILATSRIFKSVLDIPDHVDLAVILVPARFVPDVLEECGQKGVRRAIVETAGFSEYSSEGKSIEDRLVKIAKKYKIRLIGPNCIGVINLENGFCVPFPRLKPFIRHGEVSIISQSGGVGLSIMNHMAIEGIGLNKFVSVGNMLNVDAEDLLEYLIQDESTKIIFIYVESIRNGRRLMALGRKSPKPILIFKSNIGQLGKNIAASHTGSLSSDDRVVESAFEQCGITRIPDVTTLSNYLKTLRLPPLKGKRLAIISRSGGHAIIAADACELTGFHLAEFPEPFIREIEKHFRASVIKLTNPLDLGDLFEPDVYLRIVDETLSQENVDGVVFLHTSIAQTEQVQSSQLVRQLAELSKKHEKPVATYISADSDEINRLKKQSDYPIFTHIVETFRALKLNFDHTEIASKQPASDDYPTYSVNKQVVEDIIGHARAAERNLFLHETIDILELYGIPTVPGTKANTPEEARKAAESLTYPVALKVISKQISHKSDVGGVCLNLASGDAVVAAFNEMMTQLSETAPHADIEAILVQPMAPEGLELILGGKQDHQFGPVLLAGLGGVFVEIFDQASIRVAPISKREAYSMLAELKGGQILKGVRGQSEYDIEALIDTMVRLSQILVDFPQIRELDINPIRVFQKDQGCITLDARIVL